LNKSELGRIKYGTAPAPQALHPSASTDKPDGGVAARPSPDYYPLPPTGLGCSESGSCYGDISNVTGLPKTDYVRGYFRSDGVYVGSYYRSHR
jgi:hypothetical protein